MGMTFTPLFSSSAGNAYLVRDGECRLLLECGVSFKKLDAACDFSLSRLCGCLVTHEHKDHSQCWESLIRAGVPVYATEGTARALTGAASGKLGSGPGDAGTGPFLTLDGETEAGLYRYDPLRIGCFDVRPFRVFHDAAEPVGFLIRSARTGERLVFAVDTAALAYRWAEPPHIVAIECNHDPERLAAADRIPQKTRDRIRHTHMGIPQTQRFLASLDRRALREVYLLHLSDGSGSERGSAAMARKICGPLVRVIVCPRQAAGKG